MVWPVVGNAAWQQCVAVLFAQLMEYSVESVFLDGKNIHEKLFPVKNLFSAFQGSCKKTYGRHCAPRPLGLHGILSRCAAEDRSGGREQPGVAACSMTAVKSCLTCDYRHSIVAW